MSQAIGKTQLAYTRAWHHVDLLTTTLSLGRLASRMAVILCGKHKPTYEPSSDCGDYIVVTNCAYLHLSGNKRGSGGSGGKGLSRDCYKSYYRSHTTRPGSLKTMSIEEVIRKWGAGEVLLRAVNGMLPRNRLRKVRLERLKVFEGPRNPYEHNFLQFYCAELPPQKSPSPSLPVRDSLPSPLTRSLAETYVFRAQLRD